MVLLDAAVRVRRLKQLQLQVCHIDHGLRPDSQLDAAFVASHCETLQLPCHVVRLPPKPPQVNLEAWARSERYAVFTRLVNQCGCAAFVTAHSANDVAETLLMRMIAHKEPRSIERYDPLRRCIRPLLGISRSQIDHYVERYGVPFREDPSNSDTTLVRNRIRHRVLPLLTEEFDRSVVWSLSEQARSLAADCDALRVWAEQEAAALGVLDLTTQSGASRCAERLATLPPAVQWRLVEVVLLPQLGYRVGERIARAVVAALLGTGAAVRLAPALVIEARGKRLSRSAV
jgi:tRNA(Ile)-lysidine synthase